MADGSGGFRFPLHDLKSRLRADEITVDLFAGGGGASHAMETALARAVDIAINHNAWAVGLHSANHPFTRHLCQDVWEADPRVECGGRPVGALHASPDCTHFSQAKGGQPRSRATRSLSWVVLRWAGTVRPRIITLENVKQILKWGPLIAKRDKATGRVIKLDGTVAAVGERVPLDQQFLIPDKKREGSTWRRFVAVLRALGYQVDWRVLRACDYGAGTTRERLYMVARCDGEAIVWPEPTHGPDRAQSHVSAASSIDWSIPCPSIFGRKKPLADATQARIARGIKRFVLDAAEPFIVHATHGGERRPHGIGEPMPTITAANRGEMMIVSPTIVQCANASANGVATGSDPLGTITAWPRGGSHAVVAPVLVQSGYGERMGQAPRSLDIDKPLGTVVAGGTKHALAAASLVKFRGSSDGADAGQPMPTITSGAGASRPAGAAHAMGVMAAFLEQANGGFYQGAGSAADEPLPTICANGSHQRLTTAHLVTLRRNLDGQTTADPLSTICAGATHHGVIECVLSPEQEAGALRVAAFLMRYYGTGGQHGELNEPLATITTKDRLALVTVHLSGVPYVIVDIGLRMLKPHELFRAQGFPASYIIDRTQDGRQVSNSRAVAMVGNSVSPPPLIAILEANIGAAVQPQLEAA
ncbi:TPA: DNA cytosine methyltransferase [Stenotrophomonas maltophilia]|uniref:DNA cytosine methyltransferase n=1 Tax=Stenotrophomonas maltophilia TaxID=40324 RepID=UPI002097D068|nr:DNA cytosine methyltransferase [Stenotrophomonas maltophilia]MBN5044654.1 DNA cytosine methyltransferase [Stenotrophomonas maltophilia]MCO7477568.1 DNA cytosine methyltransferase [Stenotrophomonas maltophilia]HDS1367143.1 DNA cytosine methyltransferase [Stenotrophomonas maltophilia]HDS1371940.1 DNA cytosine methyltransferase [Stenotrophomonas maltophilia]HDS1376664.1 DNA cytosine methyltransferase [Stenotrophomonas maltophilia]